MRASGARAAACCALALAFTVTDSEAARRKDRVDPLGTWSCIVYGHPAFGDERVLIDIAAGGAVHVARRDGEEIGRWAQLTDWTAEDDTLRFIDSRSGREYQADLEAPTLGGHWRTPTLLGGWWCSRVDAVALPAVVRTQPDRLMPPLVPELTATPTYPLQAIRAAKQGRAVTCFLVDADGLIVQPEIVELSDEVFRAPILSALQRSRYQPWPDERVMRPGCRSFIFRLDPLTGAQAASEIAAETSVSK